MSFWNILNKMTSPTTTRAEEAQEKFLDAVKAARGSVLAWDAARTKIIASGATVADVMGQLKGAAPRSYVLACKPPTATTYLS